MHPDVTKVTETSVRFDNHTLQDYSEGKVQVSVMQCLAILIEHRLVMDRQTDRRTDTQTDTQRDAGHSRYQASIALHGENQVNDSMTDF